MSDIRVALGGAPGRFGGASDPAPDAAEGAEQVVRDGSRGQGSCGQGSGGHRRQHAWVTRLADRLDSRHPLVAGLVTALIGYLALLGVTILFGLLLLEVVLSGWVKHTDNSANHWLAGARTPTWTDLSTVGSGLAESWTVIGLCLLVIIVLLLRHHGLAALFLGVAIAIEGLTYLGTVIVIDRPRPRVVRLEDLGGGASYPSGHTAAAVATYVGIALVVLAYSRSRATRIAVIALALVAPIVVAVARVYRGMHHPIDVISGALMGLGCLAVAYVVVQVVAEVTERQHVRRERMNASAS